MKKCKHKNTTQTNVEVGGYNIPEGCITEYDVYCNDCKKVINHWSYGYFDHEPKYTLIDKIIDKIKFTYYVFRNKNDNDLPF